MIIGDDYFYTLRAIVFFLENSEGSVAEYRRKAVEAKVTAVVEQDRQALKNYLTGVEETCPQIDVAAMNAYWKSHSAELAANSKSKPEAPAISLEKMNEHRLMHAKLLEQTLQKSKAPVVTTRLVSWCFAGMKISAIVDDYLLF